MFHNIWKRCQSVFAILTLVGLMVVERPAFAQDADLTLRVDVSNTSTSGDGSNWGSASIKFLQNALDDARVYLSQFPPNTRTVDILVRGFTSGSPSYYPDDGTGCSGTNCRV